MVRRAKAQGIEKRNRTRAHGEDITQNTANASRSPLIGFNVRRVIMAFDFKDRRPAITNINDASVFTRPLDHLRASCRQGFEPFF